MKKLNSSQMVGLFQQKLHYFTLKRYLIKMHEFQKFFVSVEQFFWVKNFCH